MTVLDSEVDVAVAATLATELSAPPARLWVAFSGGIDSTALLLAALRWARARAVPVRAVYVHHGMQADADAWRTHCAQVAAALGVEFTALCVEVSASGSREAAARSARYAALAQCVGTDEVMLIAHHRDDQIETVLMRVLRGSGIEVIGTCRALGAGLLIRPLLAVPQAALADYVQAAGVAFVTDPSNADTHLTRGFIRQRLRPLIESHWPDAGTRLLALAARSAWRDRALASLLQPILATAVDAADRLSIAALQAQPVDVALAMLANWLARAGVHPLSAGHLAELHRQTTTARHDQLLDIELQGRRLRSYRGRAELLAGHTTSASANDSSSDSARQDQRDSVSVAWHGRSPLRTAVGELCLAPTQGGLRWPIAGVIVRQRLGGERIAVLAEGKHRRVKDLLRERGIAPWLRVDWPMLFVDDELVCVPHVAVAAHWRAPPDEAGVRVFIEGLV